MSDETDSWPFDQPRNCITFTTRLVMEGVEPILEAYHNADDHGWQFFGTSGGTMDNAMLVCLNEIVSLDPTVSEVADLAPGWMAARAEPGAPWVRRVNIRELDEEEFRETLREPMRRLEANESHRPIPLKDYVLECIRALELPTTLEDIEIHHAYLSEDEKYSHVLFYFGEPSRYLILVISHDDECVEGYRIMDFVAEYGLDKM